MATNKYGPISATNREYVMKSLREGKDFDDIVINLSKQGYYPPYAEQEVEYIASLMEKPKSGSKVKVVYLNKKVHKLRGK